MAVACYLEDEAPTTGQLRKILQKYYRQIPVPLAIGGTLYGRTLYLVGGALVLQARFKNNIITLLRNELTATNLRLTTKSTELTKSNSDRVHLNRVIAELKLVEPFRIPPAADDSVDEKEFPVDFALALNQPRRHLDLLP